MIKERGSAQSLELQKCQPRNEIKKLWSRAKRFSAARCPAPISTPEAIWGVLRVNFMCQLEWITGDPDVGLSIIAGCVCESVSRRN